MGEAKLPEIPNLVFIDKTVGVIRTKLERPDLAQLPYSPSIDTYKSILANGGNVQITASRGCSWGRCSYCTRSSFRIGGEIPHTEDGFNSWQGFPVERVLRDIENVMKVGITEVEFSDDDFIGDRSDEYLERIYAIAEGIEKLSHLYGINFTFRIFTRPNIIYKEKDIDGKNEQMRQLLTRLKEVGLVKVYLGIEAGNKCQLQRYCRGMILADIVGAINLVRDLELGLDTGFIIFDPDISLEEMLENIVFFRRYNLIKTNQWPSRPIFLSQGSRMVDIVRQKGRLGPVDINLMRFAYKFKDSRVAKVSKLVEKVNAIAWEIIYALKVKSKKYFDPRKKDNESELAQDYVEENALIFLDLMEECAHSIIEGRDDTVDNIIVDKAETRIWGLVKHVEMDIAEGRILDEKGQMRKILDKIYSRACFTEKIGLSSQPIIRKGLAREVFAVIASAA